MIRQGTGPSDQILSLVVFQICGFEFYMATSAIGFSTKPMRAIRGNSTMRTKSKTLVSLQWMDLSIIPLLLPAPFPTTATLYSLPLLSSIGLSCCRDSGGRVSFAHGDSRVQNIKLAVLCDELNRRTGLQMPKSISLSRSGEQQLQLKNSRKLRQFAQPRVSLDKQTIYVMQPEMTCYVCSFPETSVDQTISALVVQDAFLTIDIRQRFSNFGHVVSAGCSDLALDP